MILSNVRPWAADAVCADVVLLDAENVPDALVRVPVRRLVVAGGRLVAKDGELVG